MIIAQLVECRHRDCVVLNVLSSSPLLTINFLSVVHIFQLLLYQLTPLFCLLDLRAGQWTRDTGAESKNRIQ